MKASQADILIVPGYQGSDEDHWQSRWERKLSTAQRVHQEAWHKPECDVWVDKLVSDIEAATRPVVLVAHSLGVATAIHAAQRVGDKIAGAFLVCPPDVANPSIRPKHLMTFGPYPRQRLPFPTVVIASTNDHYCDIEVAEELAKDWGALLINAGDVGHINSVSGHGPWPEGTMVFAQFLAKL